MPLEKQLKIKSNAAEIFGQKQVQARCISKLCGLLASIKIASEWSFLNSRHLQRCLRGIGPDSEAFNTLVAVSDSAMEEVKLWMEADNSRFTKAILPPEIQLVVHTDASTLGWGCHFNETSTGGRWNSTEASQHINILELKAAFFGLKLACKNINGIGVRLETDNIVTVAYINRRGGTRSEQLLKVATELWNWALGKDLFIVASHIPGIENVIADKESRSFVEHCVWRISYRITAALFEKWGEANIDLFASRLNKQCQKYFSWRPDPEAIGTNAFAFSWTGMKAYAFPPPSLIGKAIQKATRERCTLIFITPAWPSAPFWPVLAGKS